MSVSGNENNSVSGNENNENNNFVLPREIINIYNDIARKYGNITVKHLGKYEKLQYKNNKLKLDIDFLNNCKQLGVYP